MSLPLTLNRSGAGRPAWPTTLWREAWHGDAVLMAFASILFALMVPMAVGLALDDRVLRGVPVWLKPMKFALSLGVLAWTTAYFAAMVDASRRHSLAAVRWTLIGAASFELIYIALQAARGEGSHYNVGDRLHGTLYQLMGLGAVLLTATQARLAWLVARHARPGLDPAYRLSVARGLALGRTSVGLSAARCQCAARLRLARHR